LNLTSLSAEPLKDYTYHTGERDESSLQKIIAAGISDQEALGRLAPVEAFSTHFLGKEILRKAREKSEGC